jgi:cytosine deaminase
MAHAAEDLLIDNGRFTQRRPASTSELLTTDIDGKNQLMTPALVESHVHLDKTLWGQPWRPNSAGPTLKDYIANERRILREVKRRSHIAPAPCWKTASPVAR